MSVRRCAGMLGRIVAIGALASCAATTYDTAATTRLPGSAVTTTLPTGSAETLLPQLEIEARALSAVIASGGDERSAIERIEALWAAARPDVEAAHPELVDAFDQSVGMCRTAVDRNRPADADKATKNLTTLVAAALA